MSFDNFFYSHSDLIWASYVLDNFVTYRLECLSCGQRSALCYNIGSLKSWFKKKSKHVILKQKALTIRLFSKMNGCLCVSTYLFVSLLSLRCILYTVLYCYTFFSFCFINSKWSYGLLYMEDHVVHVNSKVYWNIIWFCDYSSQILLGFTWFLWFIHSSFFHTRTLWTRQSCRTAEATWMCFCGLLQ